MAGFLRNFIEDFLKDEGLEFRDAIRKVLARRESTVNSLIAVL